MTRTVLAALLLICFGCGDDDGAAVDSGRDASGACSVDQDCSDSVFCNGIERCVPGDDSADSQGCAPSASPCLGGCDETAGECTSECADADGDGRRDVACGGDDCDDADSNRFPGNPEVCDAEGHDEDCQPATFGFRDADMDGAPDALCCNDDVCGDDCDDMRPSAHGSAVEVCDGVDNDCDGTTDEGVLLMFFPDNDGDGFGDMSATPVSACMPPALHVLNGTDCLDTDPEVHPGAFDLCDLAMKDQDCDGIPNNPDGGCDCDSGESRICGTEGVCAGASQDCIAGTWGDCSQNPIAETCNGDDDDCDGEVDEMLPTTTYFRDMDGDGFGDPLARMAVCADPGSGWVTNNNDCFDANALARPGQTMFFESDRGDGGFDYDCDGLDTREIPSTGGCNSGPPACRFDSGWDRITPPACGGVGWILTECSPAPRGSGCVPTDNVMTPSRCR